MGRAGLTAGCVTAFETPDSVAIAKILATRQGRLALPNLEKISPKMRAALIEQEDVEIPLIETLELIPEPDGSADVDFVMPERFEERQQRQRAGEQHAAEAAWPRPGPPAAHTVHTRSSRTVGFDADGGGRPMP